MKHLLTRYYLLLLLVPLTSFYQLSATPQTSSNTLQEVTNDLNKARALGVKKQFDSAAYYIEKTKQRLDVKTDPNLLAYIRLVDAEVAYWKDETEHSLKLLEKNSSALNIADSLKLHTRLLYGEVYHYLKQYPKALDQYIKTATYFEQLETLTAKDSSILYRTYFSIADIQNKLNHIEKTKHYLNQALVYVSNENQRSILLFELATAYKTQKDIQKAIRYAKGAIAIASKNEWQLMLPTYYNTISEYYLQIEDSDSAIFYAKKGLINNTYCTLNGLHINLGKGYMLKANYDKAIHHFNIALNHTTPSETLDVYENLRNIYTKTRQYKAALEQNEHFLILKDSIDNLRIAQELATITEKFESNKKQLEIEVLSKKNKLNDSVIEKKNTQIISGILLLSLLGVSISILLYFYKQQQQQKQLLFEKNRVLVSKLLSKSKPSTEHSVPMEEDKKIALIKEITSFIKQDRFLEQHITLAKMAKTLRTNTTYLSKVINEAYGKSFSNFINDQRISHTLKMLEQSETYRALTIDHIAEKAGFSSSNAFYRAFKKSTGLTPSYYIKKTLEIKK